MSFINPKYDETLITLPPTLPCPERVTIYRILLEEEKCWTPLYYANAIIDGTFFRERVYITHSLFLNGGRANPLLEFVRAQPGVIVKDLADCYENGESCINFLLDYNYEDNELANNIKKIIDFYVEKRMCRNLASELKGLLFLFKSKTIVVDPKVRFIKPHRVPFVSVEQSLYDAAMCKKTGLMRLGDMQYEMYANLSDKPLVEHSYFDVKTIVNFTKELFTNIEEKYNLNLLWILQDSNIPPINAIHAPLLPVQDFMRTSEDDGKNIQELFTTGKSPARTSLYEFYKANDYEHNSVEIAFYNDVIKSLVEIL